jgi:hypothetical protein
MKRSDWHQEKNSLVGFDIGDRDVKIFILYITHIKVKAEEVSFDLYLIKGRPTIIK